MKAICNGNDLSDAVSKVSKAIAPRNVSAIFEGIKIKAEQNCLTLTATDSELTIQKSIAADVKIEGETVVPGKYFDGFLKRLTKEQIELALDENNRLKVRYGDSEGLFQCLNAADFPQTPSPDDGARFMVASGEMKDTIQKTVFSVSQDGARPILKGVLFEIENSVLTAVALDGYRLAKCEKKVDSDQKITAIVPSRCLIEMARVLEENEDIVTLMVEKGYIMLDLGHMRIISRLFDGEFISYRRLIPEQFSSEVVIAREQFSAALDRAILLSGTEKNNLVRFDITSDAMVVSSGSEIGSLSEKLAVSLSGNDISISFNARYFVDLLRFISTDSIMVRFTTAVSPCIITPVSADPLLYLVLPVRLKG